MNELGIWTC